MSDKQGRHKVLVVGGGFAGLTCVQNLKYTPVDITLIDRQNYHLFQPLLYQVATGGLSPANIAAPLRSILRKQSNVVTLMATVTGFDISNRRVTLSNNQQVAYDTLVLATGSTHHYFGHDEWAQFAPGLKTIDDATDIRRRVLTAFENAELIQQDAISPGQLTFIVVGGGPTGVELAGAIAELAHSTMKRDFRTIDPCKSKVLLIEGEDRLLPTFRAFLMLA